MGRQLEQHRQRFIEQENLVAFLADFDEALKEDALAQLAATHRIEAIGSRIAAMGAAMNGDTARYERLMKYPPEPGPEALTPDVLLAALEPVKAEKKHQEPLTFYGAWNALADGMFTLWCNFAERIQRFWWLALAFVFVIILIDGFILHW